jgi:hypothetical protein
MISDLGFMVSDLGFTIWQAQILNHTSKIINHYIINQPLFIKKIPHPIKETRFFYIVCSWLKISRVT